MSHVRTEKMIVVAIISVLLAIGIPPLREGRTLFGAVFIAAAALVGTWAVVATLRERR